MRGLADWGTWMVPLPASLPGERVPVLCMAEQMRGRRLVASGTSRSLVGASHSSGKMPAASAWARPLEFRRSAGSEMENDGQTELAAGRRCRDLRRRRRRRV